MFALCSQPVQPVYFRTNAPRKSLAKTAEPVLKVTASSNACAQMSFQETFVKQRKVPNVNNIYFTTENATTNLLKGLSHV